jgi:hypothetical protein
VIAGHNLNSNSEFSKNFIYKYDVNLYLKWTAYFDPWPKELYTEYWFEVKKVEMDPAGCTYVLGQVHKYPGYDYPSIIKYDLKGKNVWCRNFWGNAYNSFPVDMVVDSPFRIHVLYAVETGQNNKANYYLHRLSPVDGRSYASRRLPFDYVELTAMAVDNNRNIVVTGGYHMKVPQKTGPMSSNTTSITVLPGEMENSYLLLNLGRHMMVTLYIIGTIGRESTSPPIRGRQFLCGY